MCTRPTQRGRISEWWLLVPLVCLLALLFLVGGLPWFKDLEPRLDTVPNHTYMEFSDYFVREVLTNVYDEDGFYERTDVSYEYYLVCSENHQHEVFGWHAEEWLRRLRPGQKLRASYGWFNMLSAEDTVLLPASDTMNDKQLRKMKYAEWKDARAKWQRRQDLAEINSGPGIAAWWPLLTWAAWCAILVAGGVEVFKFLSAQLQRTVTRYEGPEIEF